MEQAQATIVLSRTSPDDVGIREIYVSIDGQDAGVLRPGDRVDAAGHAGPPRRQSAQHACSAARASATWRRARSAEFLGVNKAGGGSMVMSILMAVLGVGALKLDFDRVVAP